MAIGDITYNRFCSFTDAHTGTRVTRLSDPSHVNHHMYFYNRMSDRKGEHLLICSDESGARQLYYLNLLTGAKVQLTEDDRLQDFSGMVAPDDHHVWYVAEDTFWCLDLDTLTREAVYTVPAGWEMGDPCPSGDFSRFSFVLFRKADFPKPPEGSTNGWDSFAANCKAHPLCRLMYLDVTSKRVRVVLEDRCWMTHAQINPVRPDLIMFCHEGPYNLIDARLWLVDVDETKAGTPEEPLGVNLRRCREQPSDLILTHEFWLPDGSKLGYVYRETTGNKEENIRLMDPDTLREEIFMDCSPYAHFICDHHFRYFVGDAQSADVPIHELRPEEQQRKKALIAKSAQDPDAPVGNDYIYLVDIAARKEHRLCYHGTSWLGTYGNPQDSHPHPCFTEDDRAVIFNSDRDGLPATYMIRLA